MPLTNYTIDDSQWATSSLSLSGGWNMLRLGGSNEYINSDQVGVMSPLLDQFWNQSISWTTTAGSSNTLQFIGTDIWAYGLAGPGQGGYSARVDNKTSGSFTAESDDPNYGYLLFAAHELQDGVVHTLMLINEDKGLSLAFDYAIVQTAQQDFSIPNLALPLSSSTSASPSSTSSTTEPSSGLKDLFNATSSASSNSSGLGDLAGGAKAAGLSAPQMTWSASQLAALSHPYKFHWNSASYFVVVFSALVVLAFISGVVLNFVGSFRDKMRSRRVGRGQGSAQDGESYLITGKRLRPNTRILDALKKGKISHPVPSEDGHSHRRSSYGTEEGVGPGYDARRGGQGW